MNKLILTKGVDITCASEQVILDIAPYMHCLDEEQIIIVPDRYSLITEKLVFEKLNISSTLNIRVMGINRFASLILQEQNISTSSMSSNKELLCLGRAVFEEKNNFAYFPKDGIDVSFLQQMKNTISQLKTSLVTAAALEPLVEKNDKLHDIYLIYKNYEEKQKQGVDLADFLNVFIENCGGEFLSNSRVYFAFFDSMTSQGLKIVETLLGKVKSVEFALAHPLDNQKNKFVYDTELCRNLIALAREKGIEVEEKCATSSNYISNLIAKNVYLSNPQQFEVGDFASFWECSGEQEQFEAVAREIKSHVVLGGRYYDCALATSDLQGNYPLIKRVFEEYEIPCFFDIDKTLGDTKLVEFLDLVFRYENERDPQILFDIFSNIYVGQNLLKDEIFEFIQKYSLVDQDLKLHKFECENDQKIYDEIHNILKIIKFDEIDKNGHVFGSDFIKKIHNILNVFDAQKTTQNICEYYSKKGDLENQKIYEKLFEKVQDVLNVFEEECQNEKMAFSELVTLLDNVFLSTKLSLTPLGVDVVFVGDTSKSFFESGKIFFLCGANQDRMPDFQKDIGLISDKDIARFCGSVKINPTIRTINLRKRMKLCSILSIPKQKLVVSWIALEKDGKKLVESTFVLGLLKMFGKTQQKVGFAGSVSEDFAKTISNFSRGREKLISYLQAPKYSNEIYYNSLFSVLKKRDKNIERYLTDLNKKNIVPNLKNKSLFFANGRFSVSALETYAKCPFMFYAKYGLGLKEIRPINLDEATVGDIVHLCLEKYFSQKTLGDVNEFVEKIFEDISKSEQYQIFFAYKKFASVLSSLKRECKKAINDILEEQKSSNFKIDCVEKRVGGKIVFDFCGRKIAFGGIVDRIDKCGDKVVVIDYKTGKTEHSVQDIIFGNKIQIFIYLKALENEGLTPVGALYYPISAKRKKSTKTFEGFFVGQEVENFDTTFKDVGMSKTLGVRLNKDGSFSTRSKTIYSKSDFDDLMNTAQSVMEQNLKNIASGYISPSPIKTNQLPCAFCKYFGICKSDQTCGNSYRLQRKPASYEKEEV